MTVYSIFDGELEIRRSGRSRTVRGRFNYGSMATIRDRGRVRKERFGAFRYAIENDSRQIDVLVGHDFGKPLASREDGADAVTFEARLPDDPPSWVIDAERAIAAGLMTGLIPTVIDQNPCAHLRMPRDMIFHGWSMRLFQAWQHSATMSS